MPGTLPYSLSLEASADGLYTISTTAFDYAIGGLPFLSAANKDNPIVRSTVPFRKQQFDSSSEPGEQSLDGWWIRSQQSFHGGAGQLYGDPSASDASFSADRFYQSHGVNPWTPGQISLLPVTDSLTSSSASAIASDGMRVIGLLSSGDLFFVDSAGTYSTDTLPALAGKPVKAVALDGSRYYIATATEIFERPVTDAVGTPFTAIYFTYESVPASATNVVLGWAKERLVLATENGIYELTDFNGPQVTLPAPRWTPPQGTWTPAAVAESNSAIYVAGTLSGQRSVVLKFTLDSSGAMPTLTSGTVVASLPQGEVITSIFGYLGAFLAIGTTSGPRIAAIDANGDLSVGPILFSGTVDNWVARGQYLYASAVMPEWSGTEGGLVRIDLGLQHDTLRFAYASDIYSSDVGSGSVGVGLVSAGLVHASDGGVYLESATQLVSSGWLLGSRIRYSTLEPKIYKLFRVRGPVLESDFFASVVDPDGVEHAVVGYVAGQTPGDSDVAIPNLGPLDYLSIKLTLDSTADRLTSAVTGGYQVKSVPGQPRQRMIRIPLLCFDLETDRHGTAIGGLGTALARLQALEAVDEAADVVQWQDFDAGTVDLVSIDSVEFVQTSPPTSTSTDPNFGGIITLTMRTV